PDGADRHPHLRAGDARASRPPLHEDHLAGSGGALMGVRLKVRKGDRVFVLTGKDKGRTGEVLRVLPKEGSVVVQGVNVVKKQQRRAPGNPGGIDENEAPIHVSNVAHLDPDSNKQPRVGYKFQDDGPKVRFAKGSVE